jgi:phage shock protein PspC (stress-responsive transcriptional regulator)
MERVVFVHLRGQALHIEEPAYEKVRAYLDGAARSLSDNPDQDEIIADIEQAIAEKCKLRLSAHMQVVTVSDMEAVLKEMGPVQAADIAGGDGAADHDAEPGSRKRLFRLPDGAQLSGVCAGIGAYFDINADVIRLLFVISVFLTSGLSFFVYVALMFLLPSARTSAEWARAHGAPVNAREVLRRTRDDIRRPTGRKERSPANGSAPSDQSPAGSALSVIGRTAAGALVLLFSLLEAALLIGFLVAIFLIVAIGEAAIWPLSGVPIWLALIILFIVYSAFAVPFGHFRRAALSVLAGRRTSSGLLEGLLPIIVAGLVVWGAWAFAPDLRSDLRRAADGAERLIGDFEDFLDQKAREADAPSFP